MDRSFTAIAQTEKLRARLRAELETVGGRHDDPRLYGGEPGDPGLCGGPGSVSWMIHADLASVAVAGPAAVLMEVLHPSVMHGVYTQSSYRTQPARRARATLGFVLGTTFGSTPGATQLVERVKSMHGRVSGTRADGVGYRALDPELIGWVHTCIPWAIMTAYERTRRPLSRAEKDRYLTEQARVGRMGGAAWVPETVSELEDYVARMRPHLAMNEQTVDFLGFLVGRTYDGEGDLPAPTRAERVDAELGLVAAMALMPEWARRMTGTYQSPWVDRAVLAPVLRARAAAVRWAIPELPCVVLARARAEGAASASAPGRMLG